jgi:hypothetical protein
MRPENVFSDVRIVECQVSVELFNHIRFRTDCMGINTNENCFRFGRSAILEGGYGVFYVHPQIISGALHWGQN